MTEAENFRPPETERQLDPLLVQTIDNEEEKSRRSEIFDQIWQERWKHSGTKEVFQTKEDESPFSQYSSKGWKIHLAFLKGQEQNVAKLLYTNGLYFKVEAGSGTYFNGLRESGATVYIGSHDNMRPIAALVENHIGSLLTDGETAKVATKEGTKIVRIGSGSDIEILPKITARFDVAKTPYGWASGNKNYKYAEHGLPSWTGLGGIPILKTYERVTNNVLDGWNHLSPQGRREYFKLLQQAYETSQRELVRDFGEEFVFGKS